MAATGVAAGAGTVAAALFLANCGVAEGPPAIGEPRANKKAPGAAASGPLSAAAEARAVFETPTGLAGEKANGEEVLAAETWKGAAWLARPLGGGVAATLCAAGVGEKASAGLNGGFAAKAAGAETGWAPAAVALANEKASTPTNAGGVAVAAAAAALETPRFFAGAKPNGLEDAALVAGPPPATGGFGEKTGVAKGWNDTAAVTAATAGALKTIAGVLGVATRVLIGGALTDKNVPGALTGMTSPVAVSDTLRFCGENANAGWKVVALAAGVLPATVFDTPRLLAGEKTNAAASGSKVVAIAPAVAGGGAAEVSVPHSDAALVNEKTAMFTRGALPASTFDTPSCRAGEKANAANGG